MRLKFPNKVLRALMQVSGARSSGAGRASLPRRLAFEARPACRRAAALVVGHERGFTYRVYNPEGVDRAALREVVERGQYAGLDLASMGGNRRDQPSRHRGRYRRAVHDAFGGGGARGLCVHGGRRGAERLRDRWPDWG